MFGSQTRVITRPLTIRQARRQFDRYEASLCSALPIDVEETNEAYAVEVELPGISKDDVHIDVTANEIRAHGAITQRERKGMLRH